MRNFHIFLCLSELRKKMPILSLLVLFIFFHMKRLHRFSSFVKLCLFTERELFIFPGVSVFVKACRLLHRSKPYSSSVVPPPRDAGYNREFRYPILFSISEPTNCCASRVSGIAFSTKEAGIYTQWALFSLGISEFDKRNIGPTVSSVWMLFSESVYGNILTLSVLIHALFHGFPYRVLRHKVVPECCYISVRRPYHFTYLSKTGNYFGHGQPAVLDLQAVIRPGFTIPNGADGPMNTVPNHSEPILDQHTFRYLSVCCECYAYTP